MDKDIVEVEADFILGKMEIAEKLVCGDFTRVPSELRQAAVDFLLREFRRGETEDQEESGSDNRVIEISGDEWFQGADRIMAEKSPAKVILKTLPMMESVAHGGGHFFWFQGGADKSLFHHIKEEEIDSVPLAILRKHWPDIEFVLPSGEST